jgi:hypothetical protein
MDMLARCLHGVKRDRTITWPGGSASADFELGTEAACFCFMVTGDTAEFVDLVYQYGWRAFSHT